LSKPPGAAITKQGTINRLHFAKGSEKQGITKPGYTIPTTQNEN